MRRLILLSGKIAIVLIALVVLACLIWFPQTEGRAADLVLVSIYSDPLIIYTFLASIPFFIALQQSFKILIQIENNNLHSKLVVQLVRNIKLCAIIIPVFIVFGEIYILLNATGDDFAGPLVLGTLVFVASIVIAIIFALLQKSLQKISKINL